MTQTATPQTANTWNKISGLIGNLGKDPELSYTKGGTAVTKFSIGVWQGKDKPTMWVQVECWKQLAEQCNNKLHQGNKVEIEGQLMQDVWEDKEGNKRYTFKVNARTVRLLKRDTAKAASGFIDEGAEEEQDDPLGDLEDHPF